MRGGAQAVAPDENFDFVGTAKNPLGLEVAVPAGGQNTIRISYFRTQGRGNSNLAADATLLDTPFSAGDYIETNDIIQNVKVSWDFLTWPVSRGERKIRFKTLWEGQWVSFGTHISAPLAPVNENAPSGNYPSLTKNLILPTFGGELTEAPVPHFRWEIKGSGFGIPHHGDIWDAEASLAFRFGHVELIAGGKAFHYKMSPQSDQYFIQTLWGPYAGIRYYLEKPE